MAPAVARHGFPTRLSWIGGKGQVFLTLIPAYAPESFSCASQFLRAPSPPVTAPTYNATEYMRSFEIYSRHTRLG